MNKRSIILCLAILIVICSHALSQWQPIEDIIIPKDTINPLLFYGRSADYIGLISGHIRYEKSKIDVQIYDIEESQWEYIDSLYLDDIDSLWNIERDCTWDKYAFYLHSPNRLYLLLVGAEDSLYDDDDYPDILNLWELKKEGWESISISNVYYGPFKPYPRIGFSAAISTDGRIMLYGGYHRCFAFGTYYKQTWIFHFDKWRLVEGNGPGHLSDAALAYDEKNKNFVLFGGEAVKRTSDMSHKRYMTNKTWVFNGIWKKRMINAKPEKRIKAYMYYNNNMGKIIMYSGYYYKRGEYYHRRWYYSDIWTWDGRRWELYDDDTKVDGEVIKGPITYDSRRNRMIALHNGKFWEYKFDKKTK